MLEVRKIKAVYSDVVLGVSEVSLTVPDGEAVALLGSNGSGKSTTLKSISGVLATEDGEVTEGEVLFDGVRIDRLAPEETARLGICHVLQGRSAFTHLTTEENLLMGAYLRRDRRRVAEDLEKVYSYFPALKARRRQMSGYLSGGEKQMLVIGRAFLFGPRLMLLDEPSLGLAPMIVEEIYRILRRINAQEETALLIAEQNARAALAMASRGCVLQNGRVVSEGPAERLLEEAHLALPSKVAGSSVQSPTENRPSSV